MRHRWMGRAAIVAIGVMVACTDTSQHLPTALRPTSQVVLQADAGTDLCVPTPAGYRLASRGHHIGDGHAVRVAGGRLQEVDQLGRVLNDFGTTSVNPVDSAACSSSRVREQLANVHKGGRIPSLGTGWITYALWNRPSSAITTDSTTWIVPPTPWHTGDGQIVFLFNGIENSSAILQPVLQWGHSAAGGGTYWAATCWYVYNNNANWFYGTLRSVNPGDTVVGWMTGAASGGNYNYKCKAQVPGATDSIAASGVAELTQAVETVEAYSIAQCLNYPFVDSTAFKQIKIRTGGSTPSVTWTGVNSVTDCGQHTTVVSNSNPGGEVDTYYRTAMSPYAALSGPTVVEPYVQCTWYGTQTGGLPPYTYTWDVYGNGDVNPVLQWTTTDDSTVTSSDGFSYATILSGPFTIDLTVTDYLGATATDSKGVTGSGYGC